MHGRTTSFRGFRRCNIGPLGSLAPQCWIQQAAPHCVPGPGWRGHPPGIGHGGSERVVRAAGPATQRNPAPPFFRRKDKGQPISLLHYFANRLNSAVGCGTIWTASGVLPILQGSRFFSTEKRRGGRRRRLSSTAASATRSEPPTPDTRKKIFQTLPQKLHMVVGHYLIIQV